MASKYTCVGCGHEFRVNRLTSCYSCGTKIPKAFLPDRTEEPSGWGRLTESVLRETGFEDQRVEAGRSKNVGYLDLDIKDLIRSQNRTTHAIRSLALFFFVNLTAGIVGSVLIWIGTIFNLQVSVFIGAIIVLAGFGIALASGIEELKRSARGLDY